MENKHKIKQINKEPNKKKSLTPPTFPKPNTHMILIQILNI